ncbi:MAG: VWA domain-containing protein, partial [Candidatus Baltobacteraceae bacterium]
RLIARLRLARTRRWKPMARGRRVDVRATLRATLHTGGEPIELHALGHPLRDPRFVVLIDGSRSMAEDAEKALQFARALCRRTRRARAFVFSTQLREITRALRERDADQPVLEGLGEAWGGGTRIGASLKSFLRERGTLLGERTYVMIFSDGLDTGDVVRLRTSMREIARRSAAVAWINPHAGDPDFAPRAAGMKAALPYISRLVSPQGLRALA